MRTLLSILATAAVLASPAASAADTWQFGDWLVTSQTADQSISLVSQSASATVISLDSFAAATAGQAGDASIYFDVTIPEGVVATGFTMTAYLNGTGSNSFSVVADVNEVDMYNAGNLHAPYNLDGTFIATGSIVPVFAAPETFDLKGHVRFSLGSYEYGDIGAEKFTLTFQTAPVPEPQTWLMLGGGLALMGAAAARKRRR